MYDVVFSMPVCSLFEVGCFVCFLLCLFLRLFAYVCCLFVVHCSLLVNSLFVYCLFVACCVFVACVLLSAYFLTVYLAHLGLLCV